MQLKPNANRATASVSRRRPNHTRRFWVLLPLLTLLLLSFGGTRLNALDRILDEASPSPALNQNNLPTTSNSPVNDVEAERGAASSAASLFTPFTNPQSIAGGRCQVVAQSCNLGMVMGWGAVAGPEIGTLKNSTFLPLVVSPEERKGREKNETPLNCYQNEMAEELGQLMQNDPEQQRTELRCRLRLAEAAQARAMNMARNNYLSHFDPKGRSPHYYIRQTGYPLPESYESGENYVESLAAGYADAESAWADLLAAPQHRRHVLGEVDFFRDHACFGTGYVRDDDHLRTYYVVLSAPCPEDQPSEAEETK